MKDKIPMGVEIVSVEAKDIYLANNLIIKNDIGYNVRYQKGENLNKLNFKKFINTFDFSLEMIYWEGIRNKYISEQESPMYYYNDLTKGIVKHRYTLDFVNVTFNFSVKLFNKKSKDFYVKNGYNCTPEDLTDCLLFDGEDLIAIKTNTEVSEQNPKVYEKYFYYDDECNVYRAKSEKIPTIVSSKELRKWIYNNGFLLDGRKYVRYKRSSGAARVGKCLFIDERLYSPIHQWELCGLDIKDGQEIDLASFEAYISLTLSSIIGVLKINPRSILVIEDFESVFKESCVDTIGKNGKLFTEEKEVEIRNSIWDGQSLIDISIMGDYKDYGMILLRNKFFKSCCFNCNIQQWFSDNGITDVSQLNGYTQADYIEDIKLITTPNSIKYLKFGTIDQWVDNIDMNFGVVKHEKKTHYLNGNCVTTHYQLLNSLQMSRSEVDDFLKEPLEYLKMIRDDDSVLRNHIRYGNHGDNYDKPFLNNNDITYRLLGLNSDFSKTKIYSKFKKDIYDSYIKDMRRGHVMVHGNYSTLCGNPIEMLRHSIGKFDGTNYMQEGTVHSLRFEDGEEILGTRSPHVCAGCVLVTKNKHYDLINRYMNGTSEIIYINSIGENMLQKLSGADFDSDTLLITNNKYLIKAAKRNYNVFKTSTCSVDAKKLKRAYTNDQKYDLDYKTSNNLIGEIINASAYLNTIIFDKLSNGGTVEDIKEMSMDVCQLNVLSGLQIDAAKKEFDINFKKELQLIRDKYNLKDDDEKNVKPYFFYYVLKYKDLLNINRDSFVKHNATMDHLETILNSAIRSKRYRFNDNKECINFYEILSNNDDKNVNYEHVKYAIDLIKGYNSHTSSIYATENLNRNEKEMVLDFEREFTLAKLKNKKFSSSTVVYLLKKLDTKEMQNYYKKAFNLLFCMAGSQYMNVIKESNRKMPTLIQDKYGDIDLLGIKYSLKGGDFYEL